MVLSLDGIRTCQITAARLTGRTFPRNDPRGKGGILCPMTARLHQAEGDPNGYAPCGLALPCSRSDLSPHQVARQLKTAPGTPSGNHLSLYHRPQDISRPVLKPYRVGDIFAHKHPPFLSLDISGLQLISTVSSSPAGPVLYHSPLWADDSLVRHASAILCTRFLTLSALYHVPSVRRLRSCRAPGHRNCNTLTL